MKNAFAWFVLNFKQLLAWAVLLGLVFGGTVLAVHMLFTEPLELLMAVGISVGFLAVIWLFGTARIWSEKKLQQLMEWAAKTYKP